MFSGEPGGYCPPPPPPPNPPPRSHRHLLRSRFGKDGFGAGQQLDRRDLAGRCAHRTGNYDGVSYLEICNRDIRAIVQHGLNVGVAAPEAAPSAAAREIASPAADRRVALTAGASRFCIAAPAALPGIATRLRGIAMKLDGDPLRQRRLNLLYA